MNKYMGAGPAKKGGDDDDDEFDENDLDVDDRFLPGVNSPESMKDNGTTSPRSGVSPPPVRRHADSDSDDMDDGDAGDGIVYGDVGHKKKRLIMKGNVVQTPSFKIDGKSPPSGARGPPRGGPPRGFPRGGPPRGPSRGPPSAGEMPMPRTPVRNYQSMWNEKNGVKDGPEQFVDVPLDQVASRVVKGSQELRRALDRLREESALDSKEDGNTDDDRDDNDSYDSYDSYDDEDDEDDTDDDPDENAEDRKERKQHQREERRKRRKAGKSGRTMLGQELSMREKERLREAMIMLVRSAERAGIDLEDGLDDEGGAEAEKNERMEREAIMAEAAEPVPPPSSPAVTEYEDRLRRELLKTWASQFKYGGATMDDIGKEGSTIMSPFEVFEEMRKDGTLEELAAKKDDENDGENKNGEEKGEGKESNRNKRRSERPTSMTIREEEEIQSKMAEERKNDTAADVQCEMPANVPWKAELELRPGDGKIVFVGVEKDGPAAECGIRDGDLLTQIGFDILGSRDLAAACQTIWENKRNALALSKTEVTILIVPQTVELRRRAVRPERRRGDKRRHGLGDQGGRSGQQIMKAGRGENQSSFDMADQDIEDLRVGLNRLHLSTARRSGKGDAWGLKLSRGEQRSVVVRGLMRGGAATEAGIKIGDQLLAIILPAHFARAATSTSTSRHVLLSKLGNMSRVRRELDFAKIAAAEQGVDLEVVVYRPPPVTKSCWLGLRCGFDMTVEDGNTIVSRVQGGSSAFENGIKSGDVVVSIDGVRISGPTTSLRRAQALLDEAIRVARSERRRVLRVELCRGM